MGSVLEAHLNTTAQPIMSASASSAPLDERWQSFSVTLPPATGSLSQRLA